MACRGGLHETERDLHGALDESRQVGGVERAWEEGLASGGEELIEGQPEAPYVE